jgi:hypothetical protein
MTAAVYRALRGRRSDCTVEALQIRLRCEAVAVIMIQTVVSSTSERNRGICSHCIRSQKPDP